jgi:hypothetical protein
MAPAAVVAMRKTAGQHDGVGAVLWKRVGVPDQVDRNWTARRAGTVSRSQFVPWELDDSDASRPGGSPTTV